MKSHPSSLLTVVIVTSLGATSSGQDRLKRYLNINAPQTALNAPIVLTLDGKTTLFGLYNRSHGRDVSAMLLDGKQWQPLGCSLASLTDHWHGSTARRPGTPFLQHSGMR